MVADVAARMLRTNRQYVSELKTIKAESPELFEAVKVGKLKRRVALTEVRRTLRQREAAEARALATYQLRPQKWASVLTPNTVYVADIFDAELSPESVDMIFTDPPYGREHLYLYDRLGELAAVCLKPGGSLMTYCGQRILGDVIHRVSKHLRYWWTCAVTQAGTHERVYGLNVIATWKPLVWFVKGSRVNNNMIVDSVTARKPDKVFHEWQQSDSEARCYISNLTCAGDLVLDPFCGGGTTVVTCAELGRRFVAFDIDEAAAEATLNCLALSLGFAGQ